MSIWRRLSSLLLPYTCILCAQMAAQSRDLCQQCESDLPWMRVACPRCGCKLIDTLQPCGQCQHCPPVFDRLFALCDYVEPIDRMIMAAKFYQQLVYTRILGELLAQQVSIWYRDISLPAVVIPVPLHRARLQERGYNQALEIAKVTAKALKLPLKQPCIRSKATLPQSLLTHAERSHNVANAFQLSEALSVQHAAIIDDIVTTGQTVNALSQVLRQAGITQIDVWCCARTQLN